MSVLGLCAGLGMQTWCVGPACRAGHVDMGVRGGRAGLGMQMWCMGLVCGAGRGGRAACRGNPSPLCAAGASNSTVCPAPPVGSAHW